MKSRHIQLLEEIRIELHTCPELAGYITRTMTQGLSEAVTLQKERACDMETVAMLVMNAKLFKGQESYISSLLQKHKNSYVWDDVLAKLNKKLEVKS